MKNESELERQLLEAISLYRGIVLDACEIQCGHEQEWSFFRSRLLKAFGDRGLAGRVKEILSSSTGREAQ